MRRKFYFYIYILIIYSSSLYATDWYVRPAGGNYGMENGTSYADAWEGLENVIWDAGGVQAGDTLYICGLHLRTRTGSHGIVAIFIGASGTSGNRITIRGDYPGDAGEVWGGGIIQHESWTYEGSTSYSITLPHNPYKDFIFEDVAAGGSYTRLTKVADVATCKSTSGSFYMTGLSPNEKLYVHCSDDGDPTGRITVNRLGYFFRPAGRSYITWKNLSIYCMYRPLDINSSPPESVTYMTWDGCTWHYGEKLIIYFKDRSHDILFDSCDIAYAQNGISIGEESYGGGVECYNITIRNCTIHHIGTIVGDSDAHAVGAQGCHDIIVENNEMYDCGTTICFYLPGGATIRDCIVRWNYIHDAHTNGGANGRGIAFNLGAAQNAGSTGNKIYGNIVTNCSDGIQSQFHDEVQIYNNTVYGANGDGAGRGYSYVVNRYDFQSKAIVKNNVSLSPTTGHIYFRSEAAEGTGYIISDNNDFYPSSGDQFHYDDGDVGPSELTLDEWQALLKSGCTFDPNSITGDPAFVNAGGSYELDTDFQLQPDSPAIDTGVDVGLTQDYERNPIPLGFAPDIGAFECVKPIYIKIDAYPILGDIPLPVNFTGEAMGDR